MRETVRVARRYETGLRNREVVRLRYKPRLSKIVPGGNSGVPKDRRPRYVGCYLLEELHPFTTQAVFELHKARGVPARLRQACDEAGADRIGDDSEDDRHRTGCLQ